MSIDRDKIPAELLASAQSLFDQGYTYSIMRREFDYLSGKGMAAAYRLELLYAAFEMIAEQDQE